MFQIYEWYNRTVSITKNQPWKTAFNPQAMQLQNEMIAELEAENEQLKTENAEAKPKEAYYDTLIERGESTNLRNTAKELGLPEKQFIKQLQLDKFLYRDTRKNFYSTNILIFAFLKITCKKTWHTYL